MCLMNVGKRCGALLTSLLVVVSLLFTVPPPVAQAATISSNVQVKCANQHPTPGSTTSCTAKILGSTTGTFTWSIAAQNASSGTGSLSATSCNVVASGSDGVCSVSYTAPSSGTALPMIKAAHSSGDFGVTEVGVCPSGNTSSVSVPGGNVNATLYG